MRQLSLFHFNAMKNRCILYGHVFVMSASKCKYTKPTNDKTAVFGLVCWNQNILSIIVGCAAKISEGSFKGIYKTLLYC